MSRPDPQLAGPRAERDRARAEFNRRLALAKVDLSPAMLRRRAIAEVQRAGLSATHQAIDIANDSRGVVAATLAALILWLTRRPVMAGAGRLMDRFRPRRAIPHRFGERFKLLADDYWHRLKEYADG